MTREYLALLRYDQPCFNGISNGDKLNILIGRSIDCEILARVVEKRGKIVRCSRNK